MNDIFGRADEYGIVCPVIFKTEHFITILNHNS